MDPLEELIRAQPGLSIALGVLGLVVGSFLNVVIHRLPKMMERQWERECAEFVGEEFRGEELHEAKSLFTRVSGITLPQLWR